MKFVHRMQLYLLLNWNQIRQNVKKTKTTRGCTTLGIFWSQTKPGIGCGLLDHKKRRRLTIKITVKSAAA
jgi:hypothetical protein